MKTKRAGSMIGAGLLYALGAALIIVGVLLTVVAVFRRPASKGDSGNVKGGGVIIVGPIPIVFGTDKKTVKVLLMLSIMLTVLLLVTIIVSYLLWG